ncbi:SecDF P1 head subdomain-containing protein [Alkalicoccobacillus plakortidis]|uniref:SecDF P1 head subdomain-containing protein n=1 Tax=Alkalicoccobacillus plakortidis TaxID=444060 RepID=UPI0027D96D0F|nr:hypothetical protein [Alkalicoccobacillus plakortidis]
MFYLMEVTFNKTGQLGQFDQNNRPIVTLKLKDAERFAEVTGDLLQRPPGENVLVIWLDFEEGDSYMEEATQAEPKYLSAASVSQVINSQDVQITGDFTPEETKHISEILNAWVTPG